MQVTGKQRPLLATLVVLGIAVAAPAAASAATTIGQTGAPFNSAEGRTYLQSTISSGASYTATAPGVITSWSSMAGSTAGRTQKLLVTRLISGGTYSIVQRDQLRTLAAVSQLNTFLVRLPIEAGDLIGLYAPDPQPGGFASGSFTTGDPGDLIRSTISAEPGPTVTVGNSNLGSARTNVSAIVEPDADRDGFGDESQDKCASNASVQGACPPKKCKKKKSKAKKGASAAKKQKCKKKKRKK
jgi:hypothetical protein